MNRASFSVTFILAGFALVNRGGLRSIRGPAITALLRAVTRGLLFIALLVLRSSFLQGAEPSLVPTTPSTVPDYFCTWNIQGYVSSYTNPNLQADAMIEANLFGKGANQNWVELYPEIRSDLFLVLDDTWDIPPGGGHSHPMRGSMELDSERFPSYQGTPAERLARLNRDIRAHGWRGLGLWICSARAKARRDVRLNDSDYWAERMRWSQGAGVDYWKVDWGAMSDIDVWRLDQLAHRVFPGLWIEHGGLDRTGARIWLPDKIDIFRTYDVNISVAIPETIRRVAQVLRYPREDHTSRGLINCEDEVYIGAALGCAYGVMRHPLAGNLPSGVPDRVFPAGFRDMKHRGDEVRRAVRWHRIAHPFGAGDQEAIDTSELRESPQGAGAPARVARGGLPLPAVTMLAGQDPPFVLCSRYPDGEIAVAAIGRKQGENVVIPRAGVTLEVGVLDGPVGIFGEYASLTLVTTSALAGKRILAQDLAGSTPVDITREVTVKKGRLFIPGTVIHRVGLMAGRPGDISDPGLVLAVRGLTRLVAKPAMTPGRSPERPKLVAEPGGSLKVTWALWGPVHGGKDVTAQIAGMVKNGALVVDATTGELGDDGVPDKHKRLELEYTCNGNASLVLVLLGERVIVDPQGNSRTERAPRKRSARAAHPGLPLAIPSVQEVGALTQCRRSGRRRRAGGYRLSCVITTARNPGGAQVNVLRCS